LANVCQTHVIEEYFLNNEYGHGLGEFGARFHDAEAQGDDFGCEQEVDYFARVVFDKCTNYSKRGEAKVFERPGFRCCVEEWVEKEGDVGCENV